MTDDPVAIFRRTLAALVHQWRMDSVWKTPEDCANELESALALPVVPREAYQCGCLIEFGTGDRYPMVCPRHGKAKAGDTSPPDRWQPIETAPKDGTLVLLGNASDLGWPLRCRRWDVNHWRGYDSDDATHWMPLPTPPESSHG